MKNILYIILLLISFNSYGFYDRNNCSKPTQLNHFSTELQQTRFMGQYEKFEQCINKFIDKHTKLINESNDSIQDALNDLKKYNKK